MHVRLINPFMLELAPLDTVATAANDPPGNPGAGGYDPEFREPRAYQDPTTHERRTTRVEGPHYQIRAQVEVGPFNRQRQAGSGDDPEYDLTAVADLLELKNGGLVDANGLPSIRKNDRLVAIYRIKRGGALELSRQFDDDEERLFVEQVQEGEYGIGRTRNLLFVHFIRRREATT